METTGLDNANNPFTLSNGATNDIDNVISTQKGDGLLLNLTDNFKQNGTSLPVSDFFMTEKSNGKRSTSDFDDDDDDFGPESNVDAVDDVLSPTSKKFEDNIFQDKAFEGHYNPFMEHQEKAALETEKILQKKEEQKEKDDTENTNIHEEEEDDDEFDEIAKDFKGANEKEEFHSEFQQQLENTQRLAREETPTPPADTVHNVSGLVDNTADSESEDEWNYIKGEVANKENIPPQPEKEVAEIPEEDDSMSQLNPDAAEFVPVSPTSSGPSPMCRSLINDEVIAQSPSRVQQDIDINLPNPRDFEKEVKSRPSEVDSFNGHDEDLNKSSNLINNLLNGKNIDEIPEFQPGSTPKKSAPTEEFHFGPNAVQFTPVKLFDQSEAGLSTRAVYGDESVATLEESLNESSAAPELPVKNKESDPMSMSFYEDRDNNLFDDLNKVQVIPDNLEEFLQQPEVKNSSFNETISDLPEHHPLGEPENVEVNLNNDDAIQVTDLDKHFYDDEKELASPLEPEKELLGEEESEPIKTPEPTHENLLGSEFCCVPKGSEQAHLLAGNNEIVSFDNDLEEGGVATEVDDLLKTETVNLPPDVEMIPPELPSEIIAEINAKSPAFNKLETDVVCERPASKSSVVESSGTASPAFERSEDCERPDSGLIVCERPESGLLVCERPESGPLVCERPESKSPVCERPESKSPVCERPETKSPVCDRPESKSPVCERPESKSSVCEKPESQSPVCERPKLDLPVCERPESGSPICERPMSQSPVCERPESGSDKRESESPVQDPTFDRPLSTSPICERPQSDSPVCQQDLASPVCPLPASKEFGVDDIPKSPIPNETVGLTPDFITSHQIEEAQKNFEELCRPQDKSESFQEEAVTSSIKDDVSSSSPDHVATESFELIESSAVIPTDASGSLIDTSAVRSEAEDSLVKKNDQISAMPIQTQGEEIDVKTDKITPEFAEQAVITPSEESKQEEIPSITIEAPQAKEIEDVKPTNNEPIVEIASAAAVGIAVAATAAAVAKTPETKVSEKKSTTSATKKATPKVGSATKATTPKASPKPAAPKSGTAKPPSSLGARPLSAATKPQAKPKVPTTATASASKSADRKPLTNGDIKTTVKSSLTARKETTATKTSSTAIKSSPNKPPTAKATPPPKPALTKTTAAPKPFTAKPAPSTTTRPPTTTAKRPTTLTSNKSAPSSTLAPKTTSSSSVAAKSSVTKTSPKVPTAPKPRPPPTAAAVPKPRVPLSLSKTTAKAPDTEKQNKESANKLTASKSATGTITSKTIGATRLVASSTARRVESKTSATRTTAVSKTTTTTMKSTTGKKPIEIVRNAPNKTKTTKIEKPKENGESTVVVTEELTTVVHTTNNSIAVDGDPQLMKDNSPLDNKLIINSFVDTDVVAD